MTVSRRVPPSAPCYSATRPVVSVVIPVYNQFALTRGCLDSLRGTSEPFELCVVDNASTDGTEAFLRGARLPVPLRYHRNSDNMGLIRALNQGTGLGAGDVLCFLHNDTEMRDVRWLARLRAALDEPGVGLAGLYGARRLRRDGRYVGRTIVHALEGSANLRWSVRHLDSEEPCFKLPAQAPR